MSLVNFFKWVPVFTIQCFALCILYMYLLVMKHWHRNEELLTLVQVVPCVLMMCFEVCFIRTVMSAIPQISEKYRATENNLNIGDLLYVYAIYTKTSTNQPRYCKICKILQPDRAHHCSTCDTCVLRMDHHCFWMNNCIHFKNCKFFILTQWYGAAACCVMTVSCLGILLKSHFFNGGMRVVLNLYAFTPALVVVFLTLTIISAYYLFLISLNQTCMERTLGIYCDTGQRMDGLFNLGFRRNFSQIFGQCCAFVFVPVFTSIGNGETFQVSGKQVDMYQMNEVGHDIC